ncbi:hypothetical protein L6R46_07605 [Myxococcota bacterium]|nr:hypothetical protein [Myxococcota bacterium]
MSLRRSPPVTPPSAAAAPPRAEATYDDLNRAWTRFAKRMIRLLGDELNALIADLAPARPRVSDKDT